MQTITFVRHVESQGNAQMPDAGYDCGVTPHGLMQGELLARRLEFGRPYPFDTFVSSTMVRAQATAALLSKRLKCEFEPSELLVERKKPKDLREYYIPTDAVKRVRFHTWHNSFYSYGPTVGGGENFILLKKRAQDALAALAAKEGRHALVVTHGYFLRMILAVSIARNDLTPDMFKLFIRGLSVENASLTTFVLHDARWNVKVWNDHDHLRQDL